MLCFPFLHLSPLLTTQLHKQASPPNFLPRNPTPFALQCPTFSSFSHHPNRNFSGDRRFFLGSSSNLNSSCSSSEDDFDVELGLLLALLPDEMRERVSEHPELHYLIEVVMDLGRKPLARFPSGDFVLSDDLITVQDLEYATSQVKLLLSHYWFWLIEL